MATSLKARQRTRLDASRARLLLNGQASVRFRHLAAVDARWFDILAVFHPEPFKRCGARPI
ncbi:hypothetical protein ASE02_08925 [Phenylobacterium sp. Root700]|nr:hypothetical protein ASE02_08925 [Phenylobacterium sp. Root700]